MQLKSLKIQTLPGIEPGFTFEPRGAGINIVTGPNAIGKSSLARALGYLLCGASKGDPPALSLEAEFESGETAWRVLRNGSQVAWARDGNPASPPALPAADQIGLYRLSMESLLADDTSDKALAQLLRNRLRGGYNLDASRLPLTPRFARSEEKNLQDTKKSLREAEREYDALERQEAEDLPRLEQEIKAAEEAQGRCKDLELGLKLHEAVTTRKSCNEEFMAFPSDMERLRGDELKNFEDLEEKSGGLREKLQDHQRQLKTAEERLEDTGLKQSQPDTGSMEAAEGFLDQLFPKVAQRNNAQDACEQANAALNSARKQFNEAGDPPNLDTQSLKQAEDIVDPLLKAESRRDLLERELEQAGVAPDESEINRLYNAGNALRAWLAVDGAESIPHTATPDHWLRIALWIILVASGSATLLALIQQALPALTAALVSLVAAGWGLFVLRRRYPPAKSPSDQAKQRFEETGLEPPLDWTVAAVRNYLQDELEDRYIALILQRKQATQADHIRLRLKQAREDVKEWQARKDALAREVGFDPDLPSIEPVLFLQRCLRLNESQERYEKANAVLKNLEREIAEKTTLVRDFLTPWRPNDAMAFEETTRDWDIDTLRSAFKNLKHRVTEAQQAQNDIKHCQRTIHSCEQDIQANRAEVENLFKNCGLETDQHTELDRRLALLDNWKEKRGALKKAEHQEEHFRSELVKHPEIIKYVDEDRLVKLQDELTVAKTEADKHINLNREQTKIQTRMNDAGIDHKLSRSLEKVDLARATLQDKQEQALLHEATELLLDDVEQAFQAENEPEVLSRARTLFREITAHTFDLELDKDGAFLARDLRQQALRQLGELSSGTRMQLLLALRLAWTEAQEQGGETLPLFLDEALTTSDENRFAVVANSLERLAEAQGRQVFYLSARRHECALWKQATGSEPPAIDLAAVRFPGEALPPQDYNVAPLPSLPSPEGRDPETYASVLGVPGLDPRLEPGAVHLFRLLRDDLDMLYQLMETWRITSLGQLEALLDSNAGPAAVSDAELQDRLRQRCRIIRIWTTLWRRGRGRSVNRIALEQSGAVSEKFIGPVADLSKEVHGDGEALVQALRKGKVSRFHTGKIEELERWLADEGYTDEEEILPAEERRRLALQQAMSNADADIEDLNRVITWLESATL